MPTDDELREAWAEIKISDRMRAIMMHSRIMPQINDPEILGAALDDVIAANPTAKNPGFIIGQAMEALDGRGNGKVLAELLNAKLLKTT